MSTPFSLVDFYLWFVSQRLHSLSCLVIFYAWTLSSSATDGELWVQITWHELIDVPCQSRIIRSDLRMFVISVTQRFDFMFEPMII